MSTTYTTNYHLGKQEDTNDNFNMSVITNDMNIIDNVLYNKADKSTTYTKTEVDTALDSKADASDIPNVPITAIQKNGTSITPVSGTVNIIVPTTASDVSALPDTTKYATALSFTINSSTFVVTAQLKDQNGDNLGTAQTIDLPLESVVVNGAYNDTTKKIILTLQNGNTVEFSVADLISELQTELSASNKLNPAYINYDSTHRAVSDAEKTAWNGKQSALSTAQLSAVNSGVNAELVSQISTNATAISNLQSTVNTKASQSSLNILSDTVDTKADAESITALQQQIDNLIAPTTQDAEVQNARIGADGSRYTTLGDRLNTENTELVGIINTLGNSGTVDMASYTPAVESWVQGVIDGTTGSNINSDKRIRSGYIGGDFVKITPSPNTKFYPVFYTSNSFVSSETWSTVTKVYKLADKNANQVRIVFASSDDSVITTDFASNISVYKKISNFKNIEFRGTFEDLNITDMDNLKTEGYYTITATTTSNISNYPDKFVGSAGVVQIFGNITTADQLTYFQIVTNSGGETAFRYLRKLGTKGDWTYITPKPTFKWFALGDSITQGYYSTGQNQFAITTENWVKFASQILGCTVTNYGIGGSGYMDNVHATDGKNGKQKVDSIDFSQCDLVTLAWGVNDWKYGYPLGSMSDDITSGVSVIANMRYCIEKIIADNPLCKIIVVTPLNCRGYDFDYGNESTNYGLGYTIAENGKTLQEFYEGIRTVCEYYGIEMIDNTHRSIVNRKSIVNLLKDGVHPSLECHRVLGFEMGNKINF